MLAESAYASNCVNSFDCVSAPAGEFGTRESPWFCLTKSYWFPSPAVGENTELLRGTSRSLSEAQRRNTEEETFAGKDIEPVPQELVGKNSIQIANIVKVFKGMQKRFCFSMLHCVVVNMNLGWLKNSSDRFLNLLFFSKFNYIIMMASVAKIQCFILCFIYFHCQVINYLYV